MVEGDAPKKPDLTPQEAAMLAMMCKRVSDKQIKIKLGIDHHTALSISMSLRNKLGVGMAETMRDAAKRHGLA